MRGDDSTGSHPLPHHFLLFKKINFNASCIFHVQTQQWGRGEGSQGRDPDPGLWKSQPKGTQPLLCRMPDNVGADFSLWLSFLFFFLWNKQREVNSMAAEDLGSCQRIILLPLFFSIKSNITQCVDRFPEALALSWWGIFVVVPLFYLQQNGIHSRFKVGGGYRQHGTGDNLRAPPEMVNGWVRHRVRHRPSWEPAGTALERRYLQELCKQCVLCWGQ